MTWTLNARNPGPWTGAYPAVVTAPVVEHSWRMTCISPSGSSWVDAGACWDVVVDLDLFRSPAARLSAKSTAVPLVGGWVRLYCSYTINGVTTEGTLFYGMVTERAAVRPDGGPTTAHFEFAAESAETCWDFPSNATHGISNSYTRIAETSLANVTWQAPNTLKVFEHIDLNSPTSPQLAAFRAMSISPGDNVDTFVHSMAEALGQRVVGDYRRRWWADSSLAAYYVTPREPDAYVHLDLTNRVTDWRESTTIDQQATAVDITAQWISAGDNRQSRRIYGGGGTDFTRQRSISIPMKPTGGSLGPSDPTALAYLSSVQTFVKRTTFTARAIWWLDLMMHVLPTADGGAYPVVAITWLVDAGLMTVTIADPTP